MNMPEELKGFNGSLAMRVYELLNNRIIKMDELFGVDLYIENETIQDAALNDWVSPTTAQFSGYLQNGFEYVDGGLRWTEDDDIFIIMINNTSVNIPGSGQNGQLAFTGGVNNTPCPIGEMPSSVVRGNSSVIPNVCLFTLSKGDRLDLFIKQTSESPSSDIIINKGRYTILGLKLSPVTSE